MIAGCASYLLVLLWVWAMCRAARDDDIPKPKGL